MEKRASEVAAMGGTARAQTLSKQERAQIARKAAAARWKKAGKSVPQALRAAPLTIGDISFDCAVLDDPEKTRVVSETRFMAAMGIYRSGALSTRRPRHEDESAQIPLSLSHKNLKPFVDKHLGSVHFSPLSYRTPEGKLVTVGLPATVIPKICEVWIDADREGVLGRTQQKIAKKADILLRGFAQVGIIALIDEATGYQDDRPRLALARILEQFVAKEFRKWTRTFPLEYTRELCRLRGVPFPTAPPWRLPQYFGHLTNDLIYARLAPYVLAELRRRNPTVAPGQRRHKHFQWLTENVGDPRLREHLWKVIGIMQVFDDWDTFYQALDRILPKYPKQPLLLIMQGENPHPDPMIGELDG